jgi:protein-ribulosamine 3-kinase
MPEGAKVVSAESWGVSAWNKTAKISVIFPDGSQKRYFLKVTVA